MPKVQPNWQTWWMIVGPKLVTEPQWIADNVHLAPLSEHDFQRENEPATPVPNIRASSDCYIVHYPPRDHVHGRQRLQIDVRAKDQEDADQQARLIAARILTSLTLANAGPRYGAELRYIRQLNAAQQFSAWSETVKISPRENPQLLEQEGIDRALAYFHMIESDAVAENAFGHLLTAWKLEETAGSKPLRRAILQHYILAIEAVVSGVIDKVRKFQAGRISAEERVFADEVAHDLPKRVNKPKSIREASTKLREIGLQNMLPSIRAIAPLIKLTNVQMSDAMKLYQLRSSALSHPGTQKEREIDAWLRGGENMAPCLADALARDFLTGYCGWRTKGSPVSV